MSRVSCLVEFTINDGKLDAFKDKATCVIKAVREDEPGTLSYQWSIAEDGERRLVHGVFQSSEALLAHLEHCGPMLPDMLALAPITRLEVVGAVSEEARGAVAQLGAKHFPHFAGFDR